MPAQPNDTEIFQDMQEQLLNSVLTMADVCDMWGVGRRTVEMAIWRGHIVARQSKPGHPYLIARESVEEFFGKPRNELTTNL